MFFHDVVEMLLPAGESHDEKPRARDFFRRKLLPVGKDKDFFSGGIVNSDDDSVFSGMHSEYGMRVLDPSVKQHLKGIGIEGI